MKEAPPRAVLLSDYRPFPFIVDRVRLLFRLHPTATRVTCRIDLRPRGDVPADLRLDGKGPKLISAAINGAPLAAEETNRRRTAEARAAATKVEFFTMVRGD